MITGSHACRSAMLMLAYKGVAHRTVTLPAGLHPALVRACGFPGHGAPIRRVDGSTRFDLALMDRLGTVPALELAGQRIQTNRAIARFLEQAFPDPPLFPGDPGLRGAVEDAERWGDEVLQMAARRVGLASGARGLDTMHRRASDGRLGPLLARSDAVRLAAAKLSAPLFQAEAANEADLVAQTLPLLDRVDAWIAQGVLDAEVLSAADFVIAPSLALLAYRPDLSAEIAGRPAGALLDRLLPEPA